MGGYHVKAHPCRNCDLSTHNPVYCGNPCQLLYQNRLVVERWLAGEISGLNKAGIVRVPIKDWLRENRGDRCELCGWDKVNPFTGKCPVVADHVDGDWSHNRPENLRLICPSCDSLQETYGGGNLGNGRSMRTWSKPVGVAWR